MKKLIYSCLTFLLLAYLFLPFGAEAANHGYVDVTTGQATVSQIQPGVSYSFRLSGLQDVPSVGFYLDRITKIEVFKIETSPTSSSGGQFFSYEASYSGEPGVMDNFAAKVTKVIIPEGSSTMDVQLYAVVSFDPPPGVSVASTTFQTNPTNLTVQSSSQTNPSNPSGNNNGVLTSPTTTTTTTTTTNNSLTSTTQPAVSSGTSGGLTNYIFGPACTKTTIISCYGGKIIRLLIVIASVGSLFMIIVGGIMLITSGGDPKKITAGKMAITGAIIGLIIVLLSFAIQRFVEGRLTSGGAVSTGSEENSGTVSNSLPGTTTPLPQSSPEEGITPPPPNTNTPNANTPAGPPLDPAIVAKANATMIPTDSANGSNNGSIRGIIASYYPSQVYYSLKGIGFNITNSSSDVSQARVYYKTFSGETVCHLDNLTYRNDVSPSGYQRVSLNNTTACPADPNADW